MIRFYKGIFFRLYYRFKKLNFDSTPQYSAIAAMAIVMTFNLLTLEAYALHFMYKRITGAFDWKCIFIALGFMGLCYAVFIHNNKHTIIYKRFSNSAFWGSAKGDYVVALYFLLSFLGFISLIWVK